MSPRNHQRKIARAHDHLEEIQAIALRWLDADNYIRVHEYDRSTRRYRIYVEGVEALGDLDPLPLIVGDFLHNVRSGLDHLALELAEGHSPSLSDELAQHSEFPIFGDEDRQGNPGKGKAMFRNASRKIDGVSPPAKTAIELLQPYQRGKDFRLDPLWVLYDLARIDRHRLLHLAVVANTGVGLKVGPIAKHENLAGIAPGVIFSGGGELNAKQRTKVFECVVVPINPKADVYMDVDPVPDVTFAPDTPTSGGESVVKTLNGVYDYVINAVVLPLSRYL